MHTRWGGSWLRAANSHLWCVGVAGCLWGPPPPCACPTPGHPLRPEPLPPVGSGFLPAQGGSGRRLPEALRLGHSLGEPGDPQPGRQARDNGHRGGEACSEALGLPAARADWNLWASQPLGTLPLPAGGARPGAGGRVPALSPAQPEPEGAAQGIGCTLRGVQGKGGIGQGIRIGQGHTEGQ